MLLPSASVVALGLLAAASGCSLLLDAGGDFEVDGDGGPVVAPDRFEEPARQGVCNPGRLAADINEVIYDPAGNPTAFAELCQPLSQSTFPSPFGVTLDATSNDLYLQYSERIERLIAGSVLDTDPAADTRNTGHYFGLPRWDGTAEAGLLASKVVAGDDTFETSKAVLLEGAPLRQEMPLPDELTEFGQTYRAYDTPAIEPQELEGLRIHFAATVDGNVARIFCDGDGCSDNPFGCADPYVTSEAWLPSAASPSHAYYVSVDLSDTRGMGDLFFVERSEEQSCAWEPPELLATNENDVRFFPPSVGPNGCRVDMVIELEGEIPQPLNTPYFLCTFDLNE